MSLSEIIKEIDKLPVEESLKVYSYLGNKLKKKERILQSLNEIRGIGKGLWELDAQDYIKTERASDRF
ncbi:MAG: hypothetical protein J0L67_01790 [Cytophagales bacterium]|nr:hypothetical protein [Cytophagales bacterium]